MYLTLIKNLSALGLEAQARARVFLFLPQERMMHHSFLFLFA
jgi:hypothetical protein